MKCEWCKEPLDETKEYVHLGHGIYLCMLCHMKVGAGKDG